MGCARRHAGRGTSRRRPVAKLFEKLGAVVACRWVHAEVVSVIVEAMQSEQGVNVPLLGRMAVVPVPGRKPMLIFHGAEELNGVLANS